MRWYITPPTGLPCAHADDCTHVVATTPLAPDDARVLWCVAAHGPAWKDAMLTTAWYVTQQ